MANTKTIKLSNPVSVDGKEINAVTLREPKGGDLRGTMLAPLMNGDFDQVAKVVPRISSPPLNAAHLEAMPAGDWSMLALTIVGFMSANPTMVEMAGEMANGSA
ncbi:MAG: phage tail assembly protein [Shimia sp.]